MKGVVMKNVVRWIFLALLALLILGPIIRQLGWK